jgi:murein L,D-transpeptidase YafK
MVHGACVTIGCIPLEDGPIEELYLSVGEVFGRRPIPIHIFPRRLPDDDALAALLATTVDPERRALWTELAAGWQAFERTRRVPRVRVAADGSYVVRATGSPAAPAPTDAAAPTK